MDLTDEELNKLTDFVNAEWAKNPLSKFFNIYVERSSATPCFVNVNFDEKEDVINPLMDDLKDAILKEFGELEFSTYQGPKYKDGGWLHKAIEFVKRDAQYAKEFKFEKFVLRQAELFLHRNHIIPDDYIVNGGYVKGKKITLWISTSDLESVADVKALHFIGGIMDNQYAFTDSRTEKDLIDFLNSEISKSEFSEFGSLEGVGDICVNKKR